MKVFVILLVLVVFAVPGAFAIGPPPPERVPASSHGVYDLVGNGLDQVQVGQQVLIRADLANAQDRLQPLVYVVEVYDESGNQIFRGWMDAALNPKSSFSPQVSWVPEIVGNYTAKMMVLESLNNDSLHLSPSLEAEFEVIQPGPKEKTGFDKEQFLYIVPQKMLSEKVGNKKLASLHFYKIEKEALTQLPRLDLLLDMLHSFPSEHLDNMAVRVNDSILTQYTEFFHQKCLQRTYASNVVCQDPDFAFELEEEWYLLYVSGRPNVVLEESIPGWDEDFFKRYKPFEFFDTGKSSSDNSLKNDWIPPRKQVELGMEPWCKPDLVLIQKYDGSPACVTPETKQKLIDREWAKIASLDEIRANPDLIKLNIVQVRGDRVAYLYPESQCRSIVLDRLSKQDIRNHEEHGLNQTEIVKLIQIDLEDAPHIEELIFATKSLEFPTNQEGRISLDIGTFVDYELYLMNKSMAKYSDSEKDYFRSYHENIKQTVMNPGKDGFEHDFRAPLIVYNDTIYEVRGTVFMAHNELETKSFILYPEEDAAGRKFIVLSESDMEDVPKLQEAIESIGTIPQSVSAFKGVSSDTWNKYREWFDEKIEDNSVPHRYDLIRHDGQIYAVDFKTHC